jgi:energy-coupling factor transporter transmembrane protein EcfT
MLLSSILFLIIFNGFFVPGKISLYSAKIPYIGNINYTLSGLISSIGIGLRFITAFLLVPIVISTTKPLDIITSLRYLKLPYKVSFVVSIVFRFFPILEASMIEVQEAQKSRGLETDKGNLLEKIQKSIPIVFPMIFKCLYMVDQLAWSIESRGFGLTNKPTVIKELKLTQKDKIIITISWILIIVIPLYAFAFNYIGLPEILRPYMNIANKGIEIDKIL